MDDARFAEQEFPCERRLACAIRPAITMQRGDLVPSPLTQASPPPHHASLAGTGMFSRLDVCLNALIESIEVFFAFDLTFYRRLVLFTITLYPGVPLKHYPYA